MRGLPSRFYLRNGKFSLVEGVEKSSDNIWFYCIFDKFRIYSSDFGANLVSLVQKPVSYLISNRTIILGTLQRGIQKHVPNVTVEDIDIGYISPDRKEYSVKIEYNSVGEDRTTIKDVTFV